MIRQCPPLSIRVHPRGGQTPSNSRQVEEVETAVRNSVQGVHPPDRPIAQGVRVCAPPLRTMVASRGWTVWTRVSEHHKRPAEMLTRETECPPPGWTEMDTVDSWGWSAW